MTGLLNIHKPTGMTSRHVVDLVVRATGIKRAGHAGTLDPLASGVLVVCLGAATRLVPYVQARRKVYSAGFLLGRRSDTDDITGQIVEGAVASVPARNEVETALQSFVGMVWQVPPQFSAVLVRGVRAYKAARRGRMLELEPRPVEVHRISLLEYAYPHLSVEVECGSGTYVRSIGRDLGNALGCGAVMSSLVRTAIGEFTLESAVPLEDLQSKPLSQFLLPPLSAVSHLPRRQCDAVECTALLQGKAIRAAPEPGVGGKPIAVVDFEGRLFALAEFDAAELVMRPRQVFGGAVTSVERDVTPA